MSSNLMDSAQNSTEDEPKDHTIQEHAVDKRTSASEEGNVMNQDGLEESPESTPPSGLPGYLPWEEDMEMVSKYLDRKARTLRTLVFVACVCIPACLIRPIYDWVYDWVR